MKELLKTQKIYDSDELQQFVLGLEDKYKIESAQDKYSNLVNFSQNSQVPYHQWFKYREGFAGELIKCLIEMSGSKKGEIVIDPFCGSGTTNVVAVLNGYSTLGLDVNPMSAFITSAKVDTYIKTDIDMIEKYLLDLVDFREINVKAGYNDIRKYFNEENFHELASIKTFIDSLPESKSKNVLYVAFLSIIEVSSDRKRDGNGLKTSLTKITDVRQEFVDKVNLIIKDISDVKPCENVTGYGIYDTAFNLKKRFDELSNGRAVGTVIFSPPYANSFDYFESYKLELVFADYAAGMSGISELRKKAVRSFIGAEKQMQCDKYVDAIAKEIEDSIPLKEKETGRKDGRTRKVPNMIRGYFDDMHEVIRQCSQCLETGKKTYIVVDQSAYVGKIVPTDLLFAYFAEQEGFEIEKIIECRKARTSTQQLQKYPYLKTCLRESIVELIKI